MNSLTFFHGKQLCHIAPEGEGRGFVGLRNGRIVATALDRASVARALIKAARWRRDGSDEVAGTPTA